MASKSVYIGQLNRRITIQRRTVASDSFAGQTEIWQDVACVWAAVEYPKTGSGEAQFDALHLAHTRAIFAIRKRPVEFTDRIQYDNGIWDIERIAEEGLNNYLLITAERRK